MQLYARTIRYKAGCFGETTILEAQLSGTRESGSGRARSCVVGHVARIARDQASQFGVNEVQSAQITGLF